MSESRLAAWSADLIRALDVASCRRGDPNLSVLTHGESDDALGSVVRPAVL